MVVEKLFNNAHITYPVSKGMSVKESHHLLYFTLLILVLKSELAKDL